MDDRTEESASQPPGAGKLYDAQGQVIEPRTQIQRGGIGNLTDYICEQPISAILLAFGLGYFLGKIL